MRQISGEGNAAAQAECVLRRHGGGKPEGKEGVSNSHVRGRRLILHSPNTTHTLSERACPSLGRGKLPLEIRAVTRYNIV